MLDKPAVTARFITFEGGEGVGKSTQVKRLAARLERHSIAAVRTREPGGTAQAEAIRAFILQGRSESWGPGAEAVLFAAARLDHVNQLIAPNLDSGRWVISDRFSDSTRAYQGLTGGVDVKLIDALETLALNGHKPDLTILMLTDLEHSVNRARRRNQEQARNREHDENRFEKESRAFHKRVLESYLAIAEREPQRVVKVDAKDKIPTVQKKIIAVTQESLGLE